MEKEKIPEPNPGEALAGFKKEIAVLKAEEAAAGKTAHFTELNPENLQAADLEIWQKFQDKTLTQQEFEDYREKIRRNKDSDDLAQYIANKILSWDFWPDGFPQKENQ